MASTSAPRGIGAAARIKTAASTLYNDNQSFIADVRKTLNLVKEVAVDLEKEEQSDMVKELEDGFVELLEASENYTQFSSAIQSVGNGYQPEAELTDFKKLFEDEVAKLKANSSSAPQNSPLLRHFREAIWNVHHAGQPMPGEEQEDIVMTSTQCNLLNITCPLTGKPVTELEYPVRSNDCKHIYEQKAVVHYMGLKHAQPQCPVAGCPKLLQMERILCDPLLLVEIDELRSMSKQTVRPNIIEDFTDLDED
ncbi:E3 SUMO-protein ligase MMS21 [Malania oleifera]|uniref:E3 SUMO-protein ligase MMS21 n=1 Tax=Malania oleifera TaxID=397392 RepID=UPI0025AE17D7|nr:E3 SUMO-protein ligase MMS21 [Malania oleifera]